MRRQPDFIPPKKPYSFIAMLNDILHFAALTLVNNGRLCLWMPTANDVLEELDIPSHPCLELRSVCVQTFNKCKSPCLPASSLRALKTIVETQQGPLIKAVEKFKADYFDVGSRRLLTYSRIPDREVAAAPQPLSNTKNHGKLEGKVMGVSADELNPFRKRVCIISSFRIF